MEKISLIVWSNDIEKLQFSSSYDITEIAKKNEQYKHYERVYIENDTWDFHIITITKDLNKDYENEKGMYLVEMMNVEKPFKGAEIESTEVIERILEANDFDNEDCDDFMSLESAIDNCLDDGFGIKKLKYKNQL